MSPDDPRHGKRSTYLMGCKCTACWQANADYCKRYRARRYIAGDNPLRVDAKRAVDHLTTMGAYYSTSALASLAEMNSSAISRLVNGQQDRITREVERRILAIDKHQDVGNKWVVSTYAARRIQALAALGYAVNWQSTQLGYWKQNMLFLLRGQKPYITGDVDKKVRELYDRLHMTPPVAEDRFQQASITKAKNMAQRNGWAPPLAWDNIDDPDEQPQGVAHHRPQGRPDVNTARLEDAEWMADEGMSLTGVLNRLEIKAETFRVACRRAGKDELYWRLVDREPDGAYRRAVLEGVRRAKEVA